MNNFLSAIGEIKAACGDGAVRDGEPMSLHTSMKVGGSADCYVEPGSEEGAVRVVDILNERGIPYYLLGGGTNVIVRDGGFRGAVVALGKGICAVSADAERGLLTAGAGAPLSSAAREAASAGLSGLEPVSGIPGTVGGALYMNAGSYGGDMSMVVAGARVYDPACSDVREMGPDDMGFGYRSSAFQDSGLLILSATFRLSPGEPAAIREAMREYAAMRSAKQPLNEASAGSFFKRPEGAYAGALIERAGLKGMSVGGARVSDKHAGFIVNTGGATAADVLGLMKAVQDAVKESSGYALEPEPRIIGEDI